MDFGFDVFVEVYFFSVSGGNGKPGSKKLSNSSNADVRNRPACYDVFPITRKLLSLVDLFRNRFNILYGTDCHNE